MKLIISVALILSCNTYASCFSSAESFFQRNGQPSDRPLDVSGPEFLPAGTAFYSERGHYLDKFSIDTEVFYNKGSFHSGWFKEAVILDPTTCLALGTYTVAAE
ncbi:hypothetical protein [Halobacteriovorax sp. JY17]|uniref:hypothetical protein n=1 Tax=Halobacteriovorax sp. JY17 TaxID=2014617 RepID=UPI000C6A2299|nr:hypothetical protein [Halobacteriovorax sp. JY17]PIK13686.1 MAG: hypothetical protein CES88_15965 [Halobacteriovorax sp. JY17]